MINFDVEREKMVRRQLKGRDITNQKVLNAMQAVPREKFVKDGMEDRAYHDSALPIGADQTISQPYVVALTIQALDPGEEDVILDIGTGSGYAAAVAAEIANSVMSVERIESLYNFAKSNLEEAGITNVQLRHGDGSRGWPEHAPYDGIMVAAASSDVPESLKDQLKENGKLVIPVGSGLMGQQLRRYTKHEDGSFTQDNIAGVRFVPLVSGKD
ncbi:protein-L-isoaspartate(D-aspartate) O-methyltransferase [Rhodohalobacter sp. 8-1]|uniref:protein-L-isoaspartate(D-aspartate) O-methyltransferase n=1 Tax=Rhodohalobacter sp. 8-1 TaxID=3131972 RepID=UPI0030EC6E29